MESAISLHAWGWAALPKGCPGRGSLFPTCVGVDRIGRLNGRLVEPIPYRRGDGPKYLRIGHRGRLYFPHLVGMDRSSAA